MKCCVSGCTGEWSKDDKETSFHSFPNQYIVRRQWITALANRYRILPDPRKDRVCSMHFEEDCFKISGTKRFLRKGSIPSVFPSVVPASKTLGGDSSEDLVLETTKEEADDCSELSISAGDTCKAGPSNDPRFYFPKDDANGNILQVHDLPLPIFCRTCGIRQKASVDSFHFIFCESSDGRTLNTFLQKLFTLLQIDIRENDGLPQRICQSCFETFVAIAEFHQKCKRTQDFFANLQVETVEAGDGSMGQLNFEEYSMKPGNVECLENERIKDNTAENSTDAIGKLLYIDCGDNFKEENEYIEYDIPFEFSAEEVLNENKESIVGSIEEVANESEQISKSGGDSASSFKKKQTKPVAKKRMKTKPTNKIIRDKQCRFCKKLFSKLTKHERKCPRRNIELCPHCLIWISTSEELNRHIAEMHPKGEPACSVCWATFETHEQRGNHMGRYHERKYFCNICQYDYKWSGGLKVHNKLVHAEIINRPCPICQKICPTQNKYDYHMKTHNPEEWRFQCEICDRKFLKIGYLIKHKRRHTGERPHLCSVCGQGFRLPTGYRLHMMSAHGIVEKRKKPDHILKALPERDSETKKFICDTCGKLFSTPITLQTHKRHVHKNIPRAVCKEIDCGMQFASLGSLRAHMKTQHKQNVVPRKAEYKFSCNMCPKVFGSATGFDSHMKIHSDKDRPHRCHMCDYNFKRSGHLAMHIKRIHMAEKNFECPNCDRKFLGSGELREHMTVHTNAKPYKCSICSKDFRHLSTMKAHRLMHTGEKPHSCPVCQKSFVYSDAFKRHFMRHSDAEKRNIEEQILERIDEA